MLGVRDVLVELESPELLRRKFVAADCSAVRCNLGSTLFVINPSPDFTDNWLALALSLCYGIGCNAYTKNIISTDFYFLA